MEVRERAMEPVIKSELDPLALNAITDPAGYLMHLARVDIETSVGECVRNQAG